MYGDVPRWKGEQVDTIDVICSPTNGSRRWETGNPSCLLPNSLCTVPVG